MSKISIIILVFLSLMKPLLADEKKTPPAAPEELSPSVSVYAEPGAIINRGKGWVGGEYLENLSPNLHFFVEIVKTEKETLEISEEAIAAAIAEKFRGSAISLSSSFSNDQVPTPFLHALVFVHPILNKGYAAQCSLRLFEEVKLERLKHQVVTYQAITWEKESMVISPPETAVGFIKKQMEELAIAFVERFEAFAQKKKEVVPTE